MGIYTRTSVMQDSKLRASKKGYIIRKKRENCWYVEKDGNKVHHGYENTEEAAIKLAHTIAFPFCM